MNKLDDIGWDLFKNRLLNNNKKFRGLELQFCIYFKKKLIYNDLVRLTNFNFILMACIEHI